MSELPDNCELVFDRQRIDAAMDEMATALNQRLAGREVIALCVMNGGLIFSGHLLTRLRVDVRIDYCHATRYREATRGSQLHWLAEPREKLEGRTVLILDDILDEGNTLESIIGYCRKQGAAEVVTAVLLDKQHGRRLPDVSADYVALEVEDRYVFGFGMDYEGRLRHLDAIHALKD